MRAPDSTGRSGAGEERPGNGSSPFAAFLSYSRSDRAVCERVHRGLEALGRPFFRVRGRRIFRDSANLAAADSLKGVLSEAIATSRYFILLASRNASRSDWVEFEVESWLAAHDGKARNFLILLCDGEIAWQADTGDFDWTRTTALPCSLSKAFAEEPGYSDLRDIIAARQPLTLRNAAFRDRLAEIVAPLDGRNKEEIVGRHLAVRRRLATGLTAVALFVAALGGGLFNRISEVRRQEAIDSARQRLAQAADVLAAGGDPDNWSQPVRAAVTDAQAAVRELLERLPALTSTDEIYLRAILDGLPAEVVRMPKERNQAALVSDRADIMLLDMGDNSFRVWDHRAKREITRVPHTRVLSPDFRAFAWPGDDGRVVVDVAGTRSTAGMGAAPPVTPLAMSGDGLLVAYVDEKEDLYVERLDGTGRATRLCAAYSDPVAGFSRDDSRLAATCAETFRVWNVGADVVPVAEFERPPVRAMDIAFNADGTRVALGTTRRVTLWSLEPPRILAEHVLVEAEEDSDLIEEIDLDASGGRVAVNLDGESVFCIDALSGETVWPKVAAWEFAEYGRHSPDFFFGPTTAFRGVPNGLAVFDTCTGTRLARIPLASEIGGAVYNGAARWLSLGNGDDQFFLVNLRPASVEAEERMTGEVLQVSGAAAAPVMALATASHLRVWDVERGETLLGMNGAFREALVAMTDDGSTLAVVEGTSLTVWPCLRGKACRPRRLRAEVGAGVTELWTTGDYLMLIGPGPPRLLRVGRDGLRPVPLPAGETPLWLDASGGTSRLLLADSTRARLSTADLKGATLGSPRPLASAKPGFFLPEKSYARGPDPDAVLVLDAEDGHLVTAGPMGTPAKKLGLRKRRTPLRVASDDGRFMAVAESAANQVPEPTDAETVEVVDLRSGRIVARIELPTHVAVMGFGNTGRLAIAANATTEGEPGFRLRVYEPERWSLVTNVQIASRPQTIAFAPGDTAIAVGQRDSSTAVINPLGARLLTAPQRGRVVFCQFFDGGAKLATIGSTPDLTTLQVASATRAGLAERLLRLAPWIP